MASFQVIFLQYVCPTLGAIMASVMFAAPVRDLRQALLVGRLGALNPLPWTFLAGNCLGWVAYGYYTHDPFVLAANLPGLVLSVWLNSGAARLQYLDLKRTQTLSPGPDDQSNQSETEPLDEDGRTGPLLTESERNTQEGALVMVPQERALLRVLIAWCFVIVYVGWVARDVDAAGIVGLVVNLNLVVFYGAPLGTIRQVISSRNSESIHVPTMAMNWLNTSFWIGYGAARRDAVIIVPNCMGLCLGLMQGALKALYPSTARNAVVHAVVEDEPDFAVLATEEGHEDENDDERTHELS